MEYDERGIEQPWDMVKGRERFLGGILGREGLSWNMVRGEERVFGYVGTD